MAYYRIRQKLLETCYVERDVLVEADSPEEAKQKAIENDYLDVGEDHCQEVEECDGYGIAKEYDGSECEPVEDPKWGRFIEESAAARR
jgi:hypothetical protein